MAEHARPRTQQACPACGSQTYVEGTGDAEVLRVDVTPLTGSEELLAMLEGRYTVRCTAGRLWKRCEPRGQTGQPAGYTVDGQRTTAYAVRMPAGVIYAEHLCHLRPVSRESVGWLGVASW